MTLYPTYFYAFLFDTDNNKNWKSTKLGLIYYDFEKCETCKGLDDSSVRNDCKECNLIKNSGENSFYAIEGAVRKFFGVALFITWSWLLVKVYRTHQIVGAKEYFILGTNIVCSAVVIFAFWYFIIRIKKRLKKNYESWSKRYYKIYVPVLIIAVSILCFLVYYLGWHHITVFAQLLVCLLFSIHLLIYRTFRNFFEPKL